MSQAPRVGWGVAAGLVAADAGWFTDRAPYPYPLPRVLAAARQRAGDAAQHAGVNRHVASGVRTGPRAKNCRISSSRSLLASWVPGMLAAKLGAANRAQAADRARQLGLIP